MMLQWHEIRAKLADDTLLMFRLGDFYEIFKQDAEWGAKLLGITLTHRHGMPMAVCCSSALILVLACLRRPSTAPVHVPHSIVVVDSDIKRVNADVAGRWHHCS